MSRRRQRHIMGMGITGDAFHWLGKKLSGEEALKTPQGWLYLPKGAKPVPYQRSSGSPGGSSSRLFGGRIRRKHKRRVRR